MCAGVDMPCVSGTITGQILGRASSCPPESGPGNPHMYAIGSVRGIGLAGALRLRSTARTANMA